jgi:hypothetical protein
MTVWRIIDGFDGKFVALSSSTVIIETESEMAWFGAGAAVMR